MASVRAALPAQTAAGSTSVTILGAVNGTEDLNAQLTRCELIPPAGYSTVTGAATNNVTFNVRQLRAGSVLGTVASLTLAVGSNLVAETPITVPITNTVAFQDNDVIDVQMVQNASGLAVGAGVYAEAQFV